MVAELVERVPGCGMNLVLLFLLFGCVVAESHECGSSDPTLARPGNSCETTGSRLKVQKGIALCWTTVTSTIGQMVDTRVLGEADKGTGSGNA